MGLFELFRFLPVSRKLRIEVDDIWNVLLYEDFSEQMNGQYHNSLFLTHFPIESPSKYQTITSIWSNNPI